MMMTEIQEPELVAVHVAVNRVARDIGVVGKATAAQRGRTEGGGSAPKYAFRSIDDVMNELHPILVEHGVLIVPVAREAKFVHHSRTNANGGTSISTSVQQHLGFTVVGPMGDTIEAATFGEGYDVSDKATNKSTSAALKYLLTTLFSIPTEDMEEPDAVQRPIEAGRERVTSANDRHFDRREAMRNVIAGLPDETQQRVVDWLRDEGVSLRYACTKATLDRVDKAIVRLTGEPQESVDA